MGWGPLAPRARSCDQVSAQTRPLPRASLPSGRLKNPRSAVTPRYGDPVPACSLPSPLRLGVDSDFPATFYPALGNPTPGRDLSAEVGAQGTRVQGLRHWDFAASRCHSPAGAFSSYPLVPWRSVSAAVCPRASHLASLKSPKLLRPGGATLTRCYPAEILLKLSRLSRDRKEEA